MTPGQWTVTGLILLLLGLELIRSSSVRAFFTSWYTQFNTGLSNASKPGS